VRGASDWDAKLNQKFVQRSKIMKKLGIAGGGMTTIASRRLISRFGLVALSGGLLVAALSLLPGTSKTALAALVDGGLRSELLIGRDDDNTDNIDIQAGAGANQSLNRTDIMEGGLGNDVMFGLNGSDVMNGGPGSDIILGGPDGGAAPGGPPNSDIMYGGPGNDVNLWAPGDGSEAFIGGQGIDALIFGTTDRDTVPDPVTGVLLPTLTSGLRAFPQGIPTANVSVQTQHCTIEPSPSRGYDHLVRFRAANGNIIVTVRVVEVEQVFCSNGAGGISYADLTIRRPEFTNVSQYDVQSLNPLVAKMIR
jgi:hypothetical protein